MRDFRTKMYDEENKTAQNRGNEHKTVEDIYFCCNTYWFSLHNGCGGISPLSAFVLFISWLNYL